MARIIQKAADQCEAVFISIAVQLPVYRTGNESDPKTEYSHSLLPPADVVWRREDIFFFITIIIFNVGDANAVITTEL